MVDVSHTYGRNFGFSSLSNTDRNSLKSVATRARELSTMAAICRVETLLLLVLIVAIPATLAKKKDKTKTDDNVAKSVDDDDTKAGDKTGDDDKTKTGDKTGDDDKTKTGDKDKTKTGDKTGDDDKTKTGDKTGDDDKTKTGDKDKTKTGDKTGDDDKTKTVDKTGDDDDYMQADYMQADDVNDMLLELMGENNIGTETGYVHENETTRVAGGVEVNVGATKET